MWAYVEERKGGGRRKRRRRNRLDTTSKTYFLAENTSEAESYRAEVIARFCMLQEIKALRFRLWVLSNAVGSHVVFVTWKNKTAYAWLNLH